MSSNIPINLKEKQYQRLIKEYYQANTVYLKKKYKLNFQDIFKILEKQEKLILELQGLILEIIDEEKEYQVIQLFKHQKNAKVSYRAFKINLFAVDTSKEINKKLYETSEYLLNKLKTREMKWKQKSLF